MIIIQQDVRLRSRSHRRRDWDNSIHSFIILVMTIIIMSLWTMMIMSKGDVIFVILLDVGIPSSESIAASNLSPSAVPNADPNAAPS